MIEGLNIIRSVLSTGVDLFDFVEFLYFLCFFLTMVKAVNFSQHKSENIAAHAVNSRFE